MKIQATQRTNIQTQLDRNTHQNESFAKMLEAAMKKKENSK